MTQRVIQIPAGERTSVVLRIFEPRRAKSTALDFGPKNQARFADVDLRLEWIAEKPIGRPAKFCVGDVVEMLAVNGGTWTAWASVAIAAGCPRSSFRRLVNKALEGGLVARRDGIYFRAKLGAPPPLIEP